MSNLKVAVIADRGMVQKFGRDALDAIEGCEEITLFSCTNTRTARKPLRHGAYYALNLLAVRNAWSRYVPVAGGAKRIAREVEFESGWEGAWQVLPDEIVDALARGGFDVVIKLGMGLMRVPDEGRLPVPILSWHHGDPDRYRGRPAGFWEMAEGSPVIGQIVQAIGNRLDAGRIAAYAETKVHAHSYRATLIEAYRHSPAIINEAIRNARAGIWLDKPCTGRNYRLPSNWAVAKFIAAMAARFVRRLVYGALFEKSWRVSTAPGAVPEPLGEVAFPAPDGWQTLEPGSGWSFYADPFYSAEPRGILLEALNRRSGLGEIVFVGPQGHEAVSELPGHASYPFTIEIGGRHLVVPEIASCGPPQAFVLEGGRLQARFTLDLPGAPRVLDPTLIEHEGRIWLFGNDKALGSNALMLWSAEAIDRPFVRHPMSPILVSPLGGRMGGSLLRSGERLVRLGQDFRFGYGDGLIAFEIERLSPTEYRERAIGELRFSDRRGPHTLNVRDGEILFDWYRERLAPLAGIRRIAARLARRRQAAARRAERSASITRA